MTTFKVEVIKASKPTYWYAEYIGEQYIVEESDSYDDKYFVVSGANREAIDKEDAIRVYDSVEAKSDSLPEVGDVIKFNRDGWAFSKGDTYDVIGVDCERSFPVEFIDDVGDVDRLRYPSVSYEIIKRKTNEDLIANLAQEVAQIKKQLAELKAEVSEYKTKNVVNNMAVAFDLDAIKNRLREDE